MHTVMDHLKTVGQHAACEPALSAGGWDGATLEIAFDARSTIYQGRVRGLDGKQRTWAPASRLLMAAASRLRHELPRSTDRVLICLRPGEDPWAMVHSDTGMRAIPDEGPSLRMSLPGA